VNGEKDELINNNFYDDWDSLVHCNRLKWDNFDKDFPQAGNLVFLSFFIPILLLFCCFVAIFTRLLLLLDDVLQVLGTCIWTEMK
jgi:quinol-cytochrome oxidoreductase complex cytochrome b subunit